MILLLIKIYIAVAAITTAAVALWCGACYIAPQKRRKMFVEIGYIVLAIALVITLFLIIFTTLN